MTEKKELSNFEKAAIAMLAVNPIAFDASIKTIDMIDKITRRDFLKLSGLGLAGFLTPPEKDSSQVTNERIGSFAGHIVAESGIGAIVRLEKSTIPHEHTDLGQKILRSVAEAGVPRLYDDQKSRIRVQIYNMVGIMGDEAPFAIVWEADKNGNALGPSYVAFGFKDVLADTPNGQLEVQALSYPSKDNSPKFITLGQVVKDNKIYIGGIDVNDQNAITPIFEITTKTVNGVVQTEKVLFIPPYTDNICPVESPISTSNIAILTTKESLSKEFIEAQSKFEDSTLYNLKNNGQIEKDLGDGGTKVVEGIEFLPDGTMTVIHNGETFEADATTVVIDDQKITFKDKENKTWVFDGENLKEEVREFVPAETVEFSENLSGYELKLAPDADLKAIYWDIAVVQLGNATSNSKGLEENRKVYEEIIKDFPQWEGIGSGTEYKERVAFMKEFLKRTGGTMIVQDHNFNKFEVDFNKPVKFEVNEVETLSTDVAYFLGISASNPSGRGGGGVLNSLNGQLSYTVEIVPEALENALTDQSYLYVKEKWSAGEIISNIFRLTISQTAYKDMDSSAHSYSLYTKGAEPKDALYYRKIHWTFIK